MSYEFTTDWFGATAKAVWETLLPRLDVTNALEVGAYEGASTTFLIDGIAPRHPLKLTVVDTWAGGAEHKQMGTDMGAVYQRYLRNLSHAMVTRHPGKVEYREMRMTSLQALTKLVDEGKEGSFDFIYIDGSHDPKDVMIDAILAFRLLRRGGLVIFDDYVWAPTDVEKTSAKQSPKLALDTFCQLHWGEFRFVPITIQQLALVKS